MADISQVKLPNGDTYNLVDETSGYTTNEGTITGVKTTTGAHTTIDISSGVVEFNVPTATSHLVNDSGFLTSYTETDPTVPSWAKATNKPTYTYNEVGAAPTSHSHGNITNDGDITTNVAIANGDRLVINDESASKINNSSITFGTSTDKFLSNKGTWEDVPVIPEVLEAESEGTDISLVTTGEKYEWNSKTSNTGTVRSITLTSGTGISVSNSGQAITTTGSRTISLATVDGLTPNSYGPSANATLDYGDNFKIPYITVDAYGRITAISAKTFTMPNVSTASDIGAVPLNSSNKIDATYLPSYVDDVIEGYYYNNKFYTTSDYTTEIESQTGKIYVDLITNKTYRYGSSTYIEISQGSLVTVSRNVTTGTKTASITVDGTSYDLYSPTIPNSTGSAATNISIANHGTGTVIGVQSTTTTASKVTVGSHSTDYGVTAAGSGSSSLTFIMDTTDTKKLKITFSHTHTAPTLGSKVPTVSASDITVPIKNSSASTFVTGTTHSIIDNGHTHSI